MCLDPHQNYIVTDYAIWLVTMYLDPHQNYIVTDYAIWPVTMCLDRHQNYSHRLRYMAGNYVS